MDIYVAHLPNSSLLALTVNSKSINIALQCINTFYQHGLCPVIHKSQGSHKGGWGEGVGRKDAVIYYNIDTQTGLI